jgi:hypothetical protein
VVAPLIDPAVQCTANPIMPPLPRRRDDRQPLHPGLPLSRDPGPDERTTKPALTREEPPAQHLSSPPEIVADDGASLKALRPLRGRAPPEP